MIIPSLVLMLSLICRGSSLRFLKSHSKTLRTFRSLSSSTTLRSTSKSELEWPVERVRDTFVKYFVSKQGHVHYPSSPVVPLNDPTLLFANAGMNQFKPIFIGTVEPTSPLNGLTRVVNSQKCIRAGGKHNDLDDVGKDTYHHTFFEMLGTWSFGNYFKKEAITWAYDILVNTYKLPVERLYASYFAGDEAQGLPCDTEARDFWLQYLPASRVLPFDKKANFWEMGDSGPCGPCSEIHFDRIGGRDASALVNADDPDVIEIWNLVFIQYNRETSGELRQLPAKHIDTGMGLERLTSILQDKRSNYDTDVFVPLFNDIQRIINCAPYTGKLGAEDAAQGYKDMAYRVLADHVRTLSFAIADGAQPSNEGRGYVLRRILRRAVRYGMQTLGAKSGFFSQLVPSVAVHFGDAYPELRTKAAYIQSIISEEEQSFASLLERGIKYFSEQIIDMQAREEKVVSGEMAFYLYDTLGFPVDLTQIMADEKGFKVDTTGFQAAMTAQKERGRQAGREKRLAGRADITLGPEQIAALQKTMAIPPTDDSSKYEWDVKKQTRVRAIISDKGAIINSVTTSSDLKTVGVILEDSSFYAESGGQISDTGSLTVTNADGSMLQLEVVDVQSYAGYSLHTCVAAGESDSLVGLTEGASAVAEVDYVKRRRIAPNHSMTHVLNYALRKTLGDEVDQKGSLVTDEKLRFDFSFNRAMTLPELAEVEASVQRAVQASLPVYNEVVPLKSALEIAGLRAVFGEKYPDPVRVVSFGNKVGSLISDPKNGKWADSSIEFCGGTHVSNTKEAQHFVLTEETAVAKGIRRISGITGQPALDARAMGESLLAQAQSLNRLVTSEKDANEAQIAEFETSIASIRANLDRAVVSQASKGTLREELEGIARSVLTLKNKRLLAMVDGAVAAVKAEAIALAGRGETTAVFAMQVGSDAKAIKRVIEDIKKAAPTLSFLCLSFETDKITAFAYTTDEAQAKGIKANDWVSAVLTKLGGRGGGKPGLAQGSAAVTSTDVNSQKSIQSTAVDYVKRLYKVN